MSSENVSEIEQEVDGCFTLTMLVDLEGGVQFYGEIMGKQVEPIKIAMTLQALTGGMLTEPIMKSMINMPDRNMHYVAEIVKEWAVLRENDLPMVRPLHVLPLIKPEQQEG